VNSQEKQVIDTLFNKLSQQTGPREAAAEAYIAQRMAQFPGVGYYMAQVIVVQQQALKQAEARIAQLDKQADAGSGFLPTQAARQTPGAGREQAQSQGGGFLAGAAQTALGVGGGILLANAGMALFDDLSMGAGVDSYAEGYVDAEDDVATDFDFGDSMGDEGFGDFDFDEW
jgi:hypothetical protein